MARHNVIMDVLGGGNTLTFGELGENDIKVNISISGPIYPFFLLRKKMQPEYNQPGPRLKVRNLASSLMKPVMKPDHWLFISHAKLTIQKLFMADERSALKSFK